MFFIRVPLFGLILATLFSGALLAAEHVYRWGGPGFDPALKKVVSSSRFSAMLNLTNDRLIDISVDSPEVQKGIGQLVLTDQHGKTIVSKDCHKAMRHVTAPVICSFEVDQLNRLGGQGYIVIMNESGQVVLRGDIDFNALNTATIGK